MTALTLAAIMDVSLAGHLKAAKHGDLEAAHMAHSILADAARGNTLTPYMRDVLATMHESIAHGDSSDLATVTRPPSNRRIKTTRDEQLYLFVEGERLLWLLSRKLGRDRGKRPTDTELFKRAAKAFSISPKTAKNTYLAQRAMLKRQA